MKGIIISFFTFFFFVTTNAQIEKTINVPYTSSATPTFQALLYLPSDYLTTTKSYPLLVFCHSASEAADGASAGTGLAKIYNQATLGGPSYYIEHGGWPATFTNPVTGAQEQFIVVSPQSNTWSVNGDMLANIVNYLVTTYRVDVNRIHLTGPSAGGEAAVEYAAQMNPNESTPSLTSNVRKWKAADIVPMSETTNDAIQTWGNIIVADSTPCWAFGDPRNDLRGGFAQDLVNVINKAKAGYARFTTFNTGHGPWNPFYIPTYTENFKWNTITTNYSIYTWMLGNSRIPVPIVPVANAGTAQTITLPTSQATLNGSGSTGTITSYAWTQVSGPSTATITTPAAVTTTVTGLVQGTYVFKLTVTGGSTSTVQVTVNPIPPPVAKAGNAQTITLPTSQVTLSGSTSTGTITSYAWSQVSGPSTSDIIVTPTTVGTNVTGLSTAGVYVFQLSLNGGVSTATVQVTVVQPPLVAKAGSAQKITLPTNRVTLSGSTSTGAITSFAWTQLIGPASDTIVTPNAVSTSVTGLVTGNYTFQLQITDNTGAVATSTVNVTVLTTATYGSPVSTVSASSQTINPPATSANATVNFTLTGSSLSSIKWTKFKTPGLTPKTVVFLGSSTTAGVGASTTDSSYVGRFKNFYTAQGITNNVVNLSVSGYNPYNAMPTGFVAPASVVSALGAATAAVDPNANVTKAFTFNPDVIVINFPNNGFDALSTTDIMTGLQTLYNFAAANGAQVYVTTTQPREDFSASIQTFLQVIRDSILLRFGSHAINFYDPITTPGTTKRQYPSSADAIHDNDQGHRQLFNAVVGTNVFQNKMSSTSVITNPGSATTSFTNLPAGTNLFEATVIDGHGQNTNSIATVIVNAPIPPVANPGAPQTITLPVSQVTLNGSASTGTITSYAWTQVAGPSTATITAPASASTTVTGLTQGVYVFKLTLNADTSATVQVTVNPPPAPVANAGPNQTIVLPASQVTLNGSASTGFITSYAWSQLSGPSTATITTPASVSTTVTDLTLGIYVFQLTLNGDSSATVQVTVNTPPPPIANAGPNQSIALPTDHVTLNANASTGTINSYLWTLESGPDSPPAVIVSPASDSTLVTGLVQGVYIFRLTLNGDSTATVQVTVNPPPPPVANAGPNQTITRPLNHVMLNAKASGGFITSYSWAQLSGPASDTIISPTSDSTLVTGLVPGVYVFQLTLNGDSTATTQVTVNQPPLVANAGASQTIALPANQVTLNGSASSGIVTSYAWAQISGPSTTTITNPALVSTTVTGLVQGAYIYQLTVTDDQGTVKTDTMTVTVNNGIVTKMINVRLYAGTNPFANTQWNNWSVGSGSSPVFTYADATASGVTAVLSINESVVDNGASYGGVMAPAPVLRYTSYCEVTRTLTLSGLKTAATYNIELYASRSSNSGQLTVFQVAGQVSDTIASFNNLTNKAVFTGIKANTSGKIVVTIATPTGYNYLNGFAITELTTATTGGDASTATASAAILATATDSSGLSIYPNPARDQFTVNLNNAHMGAMKIMVTGTSGATLRIIESVKDLPVSSTSIPVTGLPAGTYYITVQIGNWKETRTVLKL